MSAFLHSLLGRRFYLLMSLVCAAVVLVGFVPRFGVRMLDPARPPPLSFWIHTIAFTGWMVLVIVQSGLVQSRNVAVHRRLGFASVFFAVLLVVLGIAVAIESAQLRIARCMTGRESFLAIPISNMIA